MGASRCFRRGAGVLGLILGTATITSAQTAETDAELRLRLAQLRLQEAMKQKDQPKATPVKPLGKAKDALPEGAVARLGNSRLRHAATPRCVAFSPDGTRVVSGGDDGVLRVWGAATGEAVKHLLLPEGAPAHVRFTHGGAKLLVATTDGRLHFLDATTLAEQSSTSFAAGGNFALSPDGSLVAAVAGSGFLTVTELATGLPKLELAPDSLFAFHPSGKSLAVADATGKVTFHMLAGGKPVMSLAHGGRVTAMAIRADGKRVATGGVVGAAEVLKVWDIADGKSPQLVAEVIGAGRPQGWVGDDQVVAAGSFTSDGAFAAGVFDLAAKRWVRKAHGVAGAWAASADGTKVVATGTGGLRLGMWDLTSGKLLHTENDSFPDAALLAPAADAKSVFILATDTATSWPVNAPATAVGTLPNKVTAAAVGKGRLAAATPFEVVVYDGFDPSKPLPAKPTRTLTEHAAGCQAVAVSADGMRVAYSGDAQLTTVCDAATGKTLKTLPVKTRALALAFSPDGGLLATIGRDGFLRLWLLDGPPENVWAVRVQRGQRGTVAFSPDGKRLAASSSGMMKVVNAADGTVAFEVGNLFDNGLFQHAAFSPDGRLLFAASEGTTGGVTVWEVATQTVVRKFTTGFGTVHRLGVFADGTRVVSAGAEEAVTVWDVAGRAGKDAPTAGELAAAWGELDSPGGAKGYPATRTLIDGGAAGVRAVAAGLDDAAETRAKAARLVKQLGAEEFNDREAATRQLLALGIRALPAVQATAAKSDSPEARKRATELLNQLTAMGLRVPDHGLAGDDLRVLRAVQVLEDAGTAEARSLLTRVAATGGQPGDAAKAALARMGASR